jgi:uncharacterized protein (TIGR02145 family)
MFRNLFISILILLCSTVNGQIQVQNVTAEAKENRIFITYRLDTKNVTKVSLYCSEDNGTSWQGPLQNVTGDIGILSSPGEKEIIWDVLKDRDVLVGEQIIFRINAKMFSSSFTDARDGISYKTILVGNYEWMAENLKYKSPEGCWDYFDNESNRTKFGRLYNWESAQSACPVNWHLPSEAEFKDLISYLGGMSEAGGKLKMLTDWSIPNTGATNEVHFDALPAGFRNNGGNYQLLGINSGFWSSSTTNDGKGIYMYLYSNYKFVSLLTVTKNIGFSIRCVRKESN